MEMTIVAWFLLLSILFLTSNAADPEATTDFVVPAGINPLSIDVSFFKFTGFQGGVTANASSFLVKKASVVEFPALRGLGVSYAKLSFQAGSINPFHLHPRGTELLYVEEGWLIVGLIDSTNKLFTQKLIAGDVFVFPKGLVHFQINNGAYEVKAISAFSSENAGTVSLPATLFGSSIDETVLTKAFKVAPEVVKALKAPFAM